MQRDALQATGRERAVGGVVAAAVRATQQDLVMKEAEPTLRPLSHSRG